MKMTDSYYDQSRGISMTAEWDGVGGRPRYTVGLTPVHHCEREQKPSLDAEGAAYLAERLTDFVARFEAATKAVMMLKRS